MQSKAVAAMPMRLRVGMALSSILNRLVLIERKKPPEKIKSDLQDIIYPFAKVTREILQTLGGDYARFAREELKAAGELDEDKLGKYDFSGFPELQDTEYESSTIVLLDGIELLTQQFEFAEVEISIFQTFEFITAKLERTQKSVGLLQRLNPFNRNESTTEWVIVATQNKNHSDPK